MFASFGAFCNNLSFVPYYEVYMGTSYSNIPLVAKTTSTLFSTATYAGNHFWKIAAFNGFSSTFSSVWNFSICAPGNVGNPILFPSASTLEIAVISLSWNVGWNDTCGEVKSFSLTIWSGSTTYVSANGLNQNQTSLYFTENEAAALGFTDGCTYNWNVTAQKGVQSKMSTSTFSYCTPTAEYVALNSAGFSIFCQSI